MKKLYSLLLLMILGVAVGAAQSTTIFYESFDQCNGTGGNDNKWNGSIASTTLNANKCDNSGWSFSAGNAANKCAKFGSGKAPGQAKTPVLTDLNGNATLTFKAGAWDATTERDEVSIILSGGGSFRETDANFTATSVTLSKGAFKDFTLQIYGGTAQTQIMFQSEYTNGGGNRFFLDEVTVTQETAPSTEPTVTFTPAAGTYDTPQNVKLTVANAGDNYELTYKIDNGTDTDYDDETGIAINESCTLYVTLMDENTDIYQFSAEYTITPLTITADPDAGTYTGTQTVTLSANAEVTEWAWEFTPTGGTAVEGTTNTVTVDQSGSLYVLATDSYNRTAEATFAYTIKEPVVVDGTIIFKSNENDGSALNAETFADQITKGADEVESVTAEKVYTGVNGLKFSSSSSNGTLTLNLAKKWNLNKVSVIACNWANANDRYDAGKLKVTVNGQDSTFTLKDEYEKFDLPLTGANNVTTLTFDATNRIYLKVVDLDGTPVVPTDLADILAGEDDASYNVTEELAVLNVFDKVGYATINVAGNKDFIALDFSDTDMTPAEGTVYGNISGTLSAVKTNPVLKVTAAEVTNATVVAEPMTVDLTQVFYVPGNAFVTVAGYVDANGKLRAYNTLETHGGQSIDLDRSLLTQNLALVEGKKYIFNGVMTLKEAWTESTGAPRRVASGDLEGRYYDNYTFTATAVEEAPVITGVDNIAAGKEVKTVRYFDVAGRASAQPVQGVNIVVVEYQDGTQSVNKVVR